MGGTLQPWGALPGSLCSPGLSEPGALQLLRYRETERAREDNGEKNWVSDHCAFC